MDILGLLLALGVIIVLFALFRALVLWYWKIDKITKLLEKIEQNTNNKLDKSTSISPSDNLKS